jgi:hypothetical protein
MIGGIWRARNRWNYINPLATSEREKDILENKSESIITSVVSRYGEMSAHWHQEHQEAFEMAQSGCEAIFQAVYNM